jgi:predicted phage terminase large subunit-like protein
MLFDLERDRCERSLVYFIKRAWHVLEPSAPYVHNWHLDMIAEHLEAIDEGVEVNGRPYNRLLINLPPGGMKSLLLNVFFPAWVWGPRNKPHMRFLCAAHKIENLSARDAYKMRTLVTSDWFQARWGDKVKISQDQRGKLNFANEATGFRIATAIGSLTGIRADYVMIDDPHSVESATSEVSMQSEVNNFLEAIPTRLNDPIKSVIICIMQRLHEGDISGVILDELNKKTPGLWDHVMLPMRFDPRRAGPTLLGTCDPREVEGELFFPERFPLDVVNRDEASLGPYGAAAQFAQEPAPRGGGVIKDEWWQLWTEDKYPPLDFVCASLDTAYTTKQENDFSAMTIWGVFSSERTAVATQASSRYGRLSELEPREYGEKTPQVIMLYAWQKRLEFPDLVLQVSKDCKRFAVDLLLVESKAAGISLAQELRRAVGHEKFGVQLIDPKGGDKLSRLYSVQHIFADGTVHAPDKEWAEMVISQVRTFPKGKHDDLVDTCSQALRFLRDAGLLTRAPERLAEIGESMRHIGRSPPPLYAV